MTNLPKALREALAESYYLGAPKVLRKQVSAEDGTVKYLWGLRDGNAVETVVMRYHYGNSVCISTQVGCRQGCAFCASTIGGLVRCLDAGRNARGGHVLREGVRAENRPHRAHGHRRAAGQL